MASSSRQASDNQSAPQRRVILRTQNANNLGEYIFDSEVVPSSLNEIVPILRVANEVESSNPRVAYLCRFYAFEKACRLDPTSSGRGVWQFKTALLQILEKENDPTLTQRVKPSDAREMQNFYQHYDKKYIQVLQNVAGKADCAHLTKRYQTAAVLFEVLKAVNLTLSLEVDQAILDTHNKVEEKTKIYVPYNILPLDPDSADQAIMQYPEIQAAVFALRNTRGLSWPKEHFKKPNEDLFDWLQAMFGFQKDNVSNQREHLILLLANVHIRQLLNPDQQPKLDDRALNNVMKKLFKSYKKWCKYLNCKSSLWLSTIQEEVQQPKLLYVGLYLLIWGEAANLRFMPECLCYIYHHMAFELYGMLAGNVSPMTGENIKPAYGGDEEAFLRKVVTPIYKVIEKEAARSKTIKSKHSHWRNYDDLNEYFWSIDCFSLGWPMRPDADFFRDPPDDFYGGKNLNLKQKTRSGGSDRWIGKINFVEICSFWHIFRSFDRMWSFFILSLQAMIILAWNGGTCSNIFDCCVYKQVLSIFITAAILKLGQAAWVVILPVTYAYSWENPSGLSHMIKSWLGNGQSQQSLYILAVVAYLSPNILAAVLFLFPFVRRILERSNNKIITFVMWWVQPRLFVGRGMHEGTYSLFKYTVFWVILLTTKLAFSYYVEIKPLVGTTKDIMKEPITTYEWHEFFPRVIALWSPIMLVYFMDTQIWYAIFSTLIGGIYGAFRHLGEIRTLGMLVSRFQSLPRAFNARLIPVEKSNGGTRWMRVLTGKNEQVDPEFIKIETARFAQIWNEIVMSFRQEDLINDKERGLLLVPYSRDCDLDIIQWPPFLLASKVPIALDMASNSMGMDCDLKKRLENDPYMLWAIKECYASFKNIIYCLVIGACEREVISKIFKEVDNHIANDTLIKELNLEFLDILYEKFVKLVDLLKANNKDDVGQVTILFQDMLEVVTRDIMDKQLSGLLDSVQGGHSRRHGGINPLDQLFINAINFPVDGRGAWKEKISRLYLLMTEREPAMDVLANLDAQRRISFFSSSLFMDMPYAPKVRHMLSFSVLTPYYAENVHFSLKDLEEQNEDGVSILFYLQKIYPDEWDNFLERVGCKSEEELRGSDDPMLEEELCLWAAYRGQTLTRAVRGMMYYRKALVLQAFLDIAKEDDLMEGYKAVELASKEHSKVGQSLWAQCQAVADLKFTYVVSCHKYATHKRTGYTLAKDILHLLTTYPSLRVAYIDEVEEPSTDRSEKMDKVFYSCLVKAAVVAKLDDLADPVENLEQVIYRIKLPGPAILGEGKPENQNHAIIFTRGEALQAIDMNQEHYMEEAFKMRNLLQEFLKKHDGVRYPSILGVREHIFTASVSSLAWFMSNKETSFATIVQRVLANPLRVRFHCGRTDVFDRLFHITRGGISKASNIINLSVDIFAGFNSTLRGGNVTHHEYMQVGKGRDVGLNHISALDAFFATGNGVQTLSRDIYRLGHSFDFFRMLSCYFTTVGFYFSTMLAVMTVYVFLYGRMYLVLSGLDKALATSQCFIHNEPLQVALVSQSFVQLGFLMAFPMMMEIGLERGFRTALSEFFVMQLHLVSVLFTFSLGTKAHYYVRTLLHGVTHYHRVRHQFVVFHAKFVENYSLYSRSHFVKGIEIMFLLVVYQIFGQSHRPAIPYLFITAAMWFMVGTWLFAPFLFNPSGFEWQKIVDDWTDWNKWISNRGGIGVSPEISWESWWEKELEHLKYSGIRGAIFEILLSLRFFIYQYCLVYHLNITRKTQSVLVYCVLWLVIFVIMLTFMKTVSVRRRSFSAQYPLLFRLIKGLIFLTFVSMLIILIAIPHMTLQDIFVCILAFLTTGWGILQIAQACKPILGHSSIWDSVKALARGYEIIMGLFLFTPIAYLAWFNFVSEFQTQMLFNQAFSSGLQISQILGGHKEDQLNCNQAIRRIRHKTMNNLLATITIIALCASVLGICFISKAKFGDLINNVLGLLVDLK